MLASPVWHAMCSAELPLRCRAERPCHRQRSGHGVNVKVFKVSLQSNIEKTIRPRRSTLLCLGSTTRTPRSPTLQLGEMRFRSARAGGEICIRFVRERDAPRPCN